MTIERARRRNAGLSLLRIVGAHQRSSASDRVLAVALAFVAGAVNAGGFLAIGQYTSHMTGIVSAMADHIALGTLSVVGAGLVALVAFTSGAACSAVLINWGRRNIRTRQYAYPLALEAALLLGFGVLGSASSNAPQFMAIAAPLLCFIMGLQNATITKLSGSRMRTTHITGVVTDIGIELGKALYWNRADTIPRNRDVRADRKKLGILLPIFGTFFLGGIIGALGFGHFGYITTIPLAAILLLLSLPQLIRITQRLARPD